MKSLTLIHQLVFKESFPEFGHANNNPQHETAIKQQKKIPPGQFWLVALTSGALIL